MWDFPVVQWLRIHLPSAGDAGSIPGWGRAKILHAPGTREAQGLQAEEACMPQRRPSVAKIQEGRGTSRVITSAKKLAQRHNSHLSLPAGLLQGPALLQTHPEQAWSISTPLLPFGIACLNRSERKAAWGCHLTTVTPLKSKHQVRTAALGAQTSTWTWRGPPASAQPPEVVDAAPPSRLCPSFPAGPSPRNVFPLTCGCQSYPPGKAAGPHPHPILGHPSLTRGVPHLG